MISGNSNGKYHNAVGMYFIKNFQKTNGVKQYQYKSKLEKAMMSYLDKTPNVLQWKYEPTSIDYIDMTEKNPQTGRFGKPRKYYIDFIATVLESSGKVRNVWIEIKSSKETKQPSDSSSLERKKTWIRNNCKWSAAKRLCESKGYKFLVITDKDLS